MTRIFFCSSRGASHWRRNWRAYLPNETKSWHWGDRGPTLCGDGPPPYRGRNRGEEE